MRYKDNGSGDQVFYQNMKGVKTMDRRKAITTIAGGVAVAGLTGTTLVRNAVASQPQKRQAPKLDNRGKVYHEPLPYVKLDPLEAQDRAYKNKLIGDCQYGVLATVVEMLAEKVGEPYVTYPITYSRVGAGGTVGWGGTCGSLLGASELIYLVSPDPVPLIDDVFNFYMYTSLPDQRPKTANEDITPSIADSILCHISISHWTSVSKAKAFSKTRSKRCAQLAGSITRRCVEALNAQLAGNFKSTATIPAVVAECRACHDRGGEMENTRGKQDCLACHDGHDEVKPNLYDRISSMKK
mgnify:CR=1 FL=1